MTFGRYLFGTRSRILLRDSTRVGCHAPWTWHFFFQDPKNMKRSLIALALATLLPISAQAGELNYNYVEANYINSHFEGESGDGFSFAGSAAFNENFYGTASYRRAKNNDFGITLDETTVNLGFRHALSDKADFIAEVGYVDVGADIDGLGSDSANGYRVAAGFRGMLAPKFEGNIKAYYTDISDADWGGSELGFRVGAQYSINSTWGIVGSYDTTKLFDESINTWGIGVRASF